MNNITSPQSLSVSQIADLTGVNRGTVGYWIRSNKLCADKAGKDYSVPVQDLLIFLKSSGRKIPENLVRDNPAQPFFRSFQACWEYWKKSGDPRHCVECSVFKNQMEACFTVAEGRSVCASTPCAQCRYYLDIFYPKIQFIEQLDKPAKVMKNLYLWAVNRKYADMLGMRQEDFVGVGVERVVHPESLEMVIAYGKKRALDASAAPYNYTAFIKGNHNSKIEMDVTVIEMNQPKGAFLVLEYPLSEIDITKTDSSAVLAGS